MHEVVASLRFAMVALMFGVAISVMVGMWRGAWRLPVPDDVRLARWVGCGLICLGWAITQLFWWPWEMAKIAKRDDIVAAVEANAAWYQVGAYMLVTIGAASILSDYVQSRFGRSWPFASGGIVLLLITIGAIAALGARP